MNVLSFRFPVPRRRFDPARPEMVDLPHPDPVLLRGEMKNLRIINRRFAGATLGREILKLAQRAGPARQLEILDLATGSGDLPAEIIQSMGRLGRRVKVTALDRNEVVLEEARAFTSGVQGITLVRGDILELDYPDKSFDIVICSLTLHHFTRADAVRIIREMHRLSRMGFVIGDLRRSYAALAGAWIYTRLTTTNIMTRTDAIASVLAAFTKEELEELIREADVKGATVCRAPVFRLVGMSVKIQGLDT